MNEAQRARKAAVLAGISNDWGSNESGQQGEDYSRRDTGKRLSAGMKKQVRGRSQKLVRFIADGWGLNNAYITDHFCVEGEVDASMCAGFFLSVILAPAESASMAAAIAEGSMCIDDLGFILQGEDDESVDDTSPEMHEFFEQHEQLLTQIAEVVCAFIDNGLYVDPSGVYTAAVALVEQRDLRVS